VSIPVPDPLPDASVGDLVNEQVPREALATAQAWQEWLCGLTGRQAWVDGRRADETNFMARAVPGAVAGGYVKSAAVLDGLAVWEKI
jgi:hypothetical protein